MNLRSVDLNLLVVFDRLMRTRSVSVTARDLMMTPSAVSHALRRLRTLLNDELLVRGPEGFVPTRRAEELQNDLGETLSTIDSAIAHQVRFDPRQSTRIFTLDLSDYIGAFLLPPLCSRLRALAPGVRLKVERHFSTPEQPGMGELQVRVGWVSHLTDYRREKLFEDDYVVVMSPDNPAADRPLDVAAYASLAHVKVSSAALGTTAIDDALAKRGLVRNVVVTVANWFEAARIVERTDLVAAVPRPWAAIEQRLSGLIQRPLPFDDVRFVVEQCWHPGKDHDTGHGWFRSQVKTVFDESAWIAAPRENDPTRIERRSG